MAKAEDLKRSAIRTIAQSKFKQSLKKPGDLPVIALDLSAQWLTDLDAVLEKTTPGNIQKCRGWIMRYIAPHKERIAVLGDYVISVSRNLTMELNANGQPTAAAQRTQLAFLRLYSDVLHADKFHSRSSDVKGIFGKESIPFLTKLVTFAASGMTTPKSAMEENLRAILNFWALNHYISVPDAKSLQEGAEEALFIAQGGTPVRKRHYLVPEYHGPRNASWQGLPASYMLGHLVKHPNKAIHPSLIKVQKLGEGRASDKVCKLLDNFFENVDLKYHPTGDRPTGETDKHHLLLDASGHAVKRNKETGEQVKLYSGPGWSAKVSQDVRKDGVPEAVKLAREQAKREDELKDDKQKAFEQRHDRHRSRSPRRRDRSSSESSYTREREYRGRQSAYDARDSRSRSRDRSYGRRSSPGYRRRGSDDYDNDGRSRDNARSPSRPKAAMPPFAPPQQMGPPVQGQYPRPPFSVPPPPPFQVGAFPGGVPPPPPPQPNGGFVPPPPNMAAMSNNSNTFGNNQYGNNQGGQGGNLRGGNAQGGNGGYGNNQGFNQYHQGNFRGGRGGYRGNNRGGYGGYQRGQRGGRW